MRGVVNRGLLLLLDFENLIYIDVYRCLFTSMYNKVICVNLFSIIFIIIKKPRKI